MPLPNLATRQPASVRRRSTTAGLDTRLPQPRTVARRDPLVAWMRQTFRLSADLAEADALELVLPAGTTHGEVRATIDADGVRFTFLPEPET